MTKTEAAKIVRKKYPNRKFRWNNANQVCVVSRSGTYQLSDWKDSRDEAIISAAEWIKKGTVTK